MICLALGLGLLGFVAVRRARHFHSCYAHGDPHRFGPPWSPWHGGHHRHGVGSRPGRRGLYLALARLDCSPAQERAIIGEVDHLMAKFRDTRDHLTDVRGDLAAAVRGPTLDDAALGAVLGRVDAATGEARAAMLDAIRTIHALLDDPQREQLASLLAEPGFGWPDGAGGRYGGGHEGGWRRGGGSPYRV